MFWKPKPPTAPASLNTSAASIPEQIDLNQSTQPTHPHDELIATALPTPPQSRDASYVGHINSLDVDDSESDGEEDGEDDGVLYRSMVEAGNVAVGEIRGGGGLSSEEDQGVSYLGDLGEEECDFEREVDVTVDDEVLHEDLGEDLGEGSPVREKKNPGQCFSPEGVERWKGIEPATDRDSPATSLDAPSTSLGAPSTSLEGGANLPQSPQTDTPQRASVTTPVSTGGDEWREAVSVSGKKYYYNRRTRESKWTLPRSAVVEGGRVVVGSAHKGTPARASPARPTTSTPAHVMTPSGVDPQERQMKAKIREGERSKRREEMRGKARREMGEEAPPAAPAVDKSTTKKTTRSEAAAASARSALKDLSLNETRDNLDSTFLDEGVSHLGISHISAKTPSLQAQPQATTTAHTISPPPALINNVERRRLFDENSVAVANVYCVYCGHGCEPSSLGGHLKECFVFERTWKVDGVQRVVEGAIMGAWGLNLVGSPNKEAVVTSRSEEESCPHCARTFASGRMGAHMKVCQSVFGNTNKRPSSTPGRSTPGKNGRTPNRATPSPPRARAGEEHGEEGVGGSACVCCGGGFAGVGTTERLAHYRTCLEGVTDGRVLDAAAASCGGSCPWCAHPTIKLSNHLGRCRQWKKKAIMKGGGGGGVMGLTV